MIPEVKGTFLQRQHNADIYHQELWQQVQHLEAANTSLETANAALQKEKSQRQTTTHNEHVNDNITTKVHKAIEGVHMSHVAEDLGH